MLIIWPLELPELCRPGISDAVGWARATTADRLGSIPGWVIPNTWKTAFAACPVLCFAQSSVRQYFKRVTCIMLRIHWQVTLCCGAPYCVIVSRPCYLNDVDTLYGSVACHKLNFINIDVVAHPVLYNLSYVIGFTFRLVHFLLQNIKYIFDGILLSFISVEKTFFQTL